MKVASMAGEILIFCFLLFVVDAAPRTTGVPKMSMTVKIAKVPNPIKGYTLTSTGQEVAESEYSMNYATNGELTFQMSTVKKNRQYALTWEDVMYRFSFSNKGRAPFRMSPIDPPKDNKYSSEEGKSLTVPLLVSGSSIGEKLDRDGVIVAQSDYDLTYKIEMYPNKKVYLKIRDGVKAGNYNLSLINEFGEIVNYGFVKDEKEKEKETVVGALIPILGVMLLAMIISLVFLVIYCPGLLIAILIRTCLSKICGIC